MLELAPDHLQAKTLCKHAVKKLPLLIKYVLDQYETREMCNKVILENGEMLMFIPDCCIYFRITTLLSN